MSSEFLFLAPYPNEQNNKDGMISRIKDIDILFEDLERTYLTVSLRRNLKSFKKIGNVKIIEVNLFLNFFYLFKLIRGHKFIYVHSVFNLRYLWQYLFFLNKNQVLILDAHGLVSEEFKFFDKKETIARYFSLIEKLVFKRLNHGIFVTHAMSSYFNRKYPDSFFKSNIYHIIPRNLKKMISAQKESTKSASCDKIQVIYSGGVHPWQNIDLMLDSIKSNQNENVHYTILTNEVEYIKKLIVEKDINRDLVNVDSRSPENLWQDYMNADYGFVLRQDNVVNNVACPTKLIEYMYYGIRPHSFNSKYW